MTDEQGNLSSSSARSSSSRLSSWRNFSALLSSVRAFLRRQLSRQPVMLGLLVALAVLSFLAVSGLSRAYQTQRESLGNRWFARGMTDLTARQYNQAVIEFRAALLYSRDDYTYELNLAEALVGLKRSNEAYSYLINLWERQPSDGLVNLELAHIAAQRGESEQAQRYYHDAIYAAWPSDQEEKRRAARVELIEFLLQNYRRAQAESEVIALEANVVDDAARGDLSRDDAALQAQVGDFFVRTLDYDRALAAYRLSLKSEGNNPKAMAGAGRAAFEMALYPEALRYLQSAVSADPADSESAQRLKTTEWVLQSDPFQREISAAQRSKIVVGDFGAAGQRLRACGTERDSTVPDAEPNLAERWATMKPHITVPGLERRPESVEAAMELVFDIERRTQQQAQQSSSGCGAPKGIDLALLLIAKMHESN